MAERDLGTNVLAAIAAGGVLRPFLLYEGEFSTGHLRLFTGVGTLTWDSKEWIGGRDLLGITPVRESTSLEAIGFAVRMTGLNTASLSVALQSMRKTLPGRLWLGFLDAAGAIIDDPYPMRRGRFDIAEIARDAASGTMTIEARYEGPLARLLTANVRHYTHADQQLRLAGDLGFDQVPELQDAADIWGPEVPGATPPAYYSPPMPPPERA